jgi:hypothetical protein
MLIGASAVDENVEWIAVRERDRYCSEVRQIHSNERRADFVGQPRAIGRVDVGDKHVCTGRCEPNGGRRTHAACTTRYQGAPPFDVVRRHRVSAP